MENELRILYEDNHLLGVCKPGGVLSQGDSTGDDTALAMAKRYIKKKYQKPGDVFLGLVHRIDRPVSGVLLFARTSKAASRLTKEFRDRTVEKAYLAVAIGNVEEREGELVSYLERVRTRSRTVEPSVPGAKKAVTHYTVLNRRDGLSLLEVVPATGRHHQIRVHLAGMSHPVVGDLKYGVKKPLADKTIALHAARLRVKHPVKDETVTLEAPVPDGYPWQLFTATIDSYFERRESEPRREPRLD